MAPLLSQLRPEQLIPSKCNAAALGFVLPCSCSSFTCRAGTASPLKPSLILFTEHGRQTLLPIPLNLEEIWSTWLLSHLIMSSWLCCCFWAACSLSCSSLHSACMPLKLAQAHWTAPAHALPLSQTSVSAASEAPNFWQLVEIKGSSDDNMHCSHSQQL